METKILELNKATKHATEIQESHLIEKSRDENDFIVPNSKKVN